MNWLTKQKTSSNDKKTMEYTKLLGRWFSRIRSFPSRMTEPVWTIRTEGTPGNSRCKSPKRRTYRIIGYSKEGAERYAERLQMFRGLKILWIKPEKNERS